MADGGKRDPSSHRTPAQIKKMDRGYNAQPHKIKDRAQQNAARSYMKKKHGAAALAGKDVAHGKAVSAGGSNKPLNLSIQSQKKNRGWRRNGPRP